MVEAQKRQYYVTRERQSYSLAFDYDINPNHRLTLQGIYNRRHDWETATASPIRIWIRQD